MASLSEAESSKQRRRVPGRLIEAPDAGRFIAPPRCQSTKLNGIERKVQRQRLQSSSVRKTDFHIILSPWILQLFWRSAAAF